MPPESHTPMRRIRMVGELWEEFGRATKAAGTDRSAVVRDFVRWYLWHGKMPKRPNRAAYAAAEPPATDQP